MLKPFKKELEKNKKIFLKIKVVTGKPKTKIKEIMNSVIKINISAHPEKGRANIELMNFLGKSFNVQKDNIKIISGKTNKVKLIKINL